MTQVLAGTVKTVQYQLIDFLVIINSFESCAFTTNFREQRSKGKYTKSLVVLQLYLILWIIICNRVIVYSYISRLTSQ